jgi:hypothetical protein
MRSLPHHSLPYWMDVLRTLRVHSNVATFTAEAALKVLEP